MAVQGKPPPLTLIHTTCGCDSHPVVTCSHCGESVGARDAKYRDGPGAGRCPAKPGRNTRRPSDGSRFVLGRPSSVSRALEIIGDKWSFMVVREGFFGNRRYDKILTELAIAPNILTDRLNRLVASGVFHRRQYQSSPDRYEYLLTDMGRDLYGPFIAMLHGGDRWLSKGKPPLILTHLKCGTRLPAVGGLRPLQQADRRRGHALSLAYDPKSFGALGPRSVPRRAVRQSCHMEPMVDGGFPCFAVGETRSGIMAGWRRAVELAMTDEEIERSTALSRSRTEPASRVSRRRCCWPIARISSVRWAKSWFTIKRFSAA